MRELRISEKAIEQLEYHKIRELLKGHCRGVSGQEYIDAQGFVLDIDEIYQRLSIVHEYVQRITDGYDPVWNEYLSIDQELFYLTKDGYVLEADSMVKMLHVLINYHDFYHSFKKDQKKAYPTLYAAVVIDDYSDAPIKSIQRVFDSEGNIRENASPELKRIIKRQESVNRQLDAEFNKIVSKYKGESVLSDNAESWRNGRRVLVLPVENKRKVAGVIHDESASGKTVFIEPEGVMRINNELFSLDSEKRAEVYRILRDLSAELVGYRDMIDRIAEKVIQIDVYRAKAKLSVRLDGVMPKLTKHATLSLHQVRHPLLYLQLQDREDQETVPFDLDIRGQNRLLLISGPNAGGKSVTLKAVGLVHLLTYIGVLPPVDERSTIGLYDSIFTDIGDQQSIDEGLSTYSSHLNNLNKIVKESGNKSLVLLDEIGSGTDPKLGGAIAEGIIRALLAKKVYGIITTHYSALKVFAFKNQGIVNGAMLFDKENLQPTYRLKVGKPGSSYAFEVAKKIGLDDRIINYARKKVGKKENEVEDLLIDLQEGKAIIEEQLDYIANEKDKLDRLIKTYDKLNEEYQVKRKKLQIKAKELTYQKSHEENLELQKVINQLQKEKNLEKAYELKEKAAQKRRSESDQIVALREDVREVRASDEPIEVGDFVRMLDSDMSGEVINIQGKKAEVLFGMMKMQVPLKDLIRTGSHLKTNKIRVNIKGVAFENNFSPKLDIRGYKIKDAEDTLQEFFDKALLSNARTLEIVHGKGSGALRKLVIRKTKEYKDIESYWHPADEQGGDGVTMIKM